MLDLKVGSTVLVVKDLYPYRDSGRVLKEGEEAQVIEINSRGVRFKDVRGNYPFKNIENFLVSLDSASNS